jgi:hypothetical protein
MNIIIIISFAVFVVLPVSGSNAITKHINKFILVHAMKK